MQTVEVPSAPSMITADRRTVLSAGLLGLAGIPAAAQANPFQSTRGFTHNVASGEPAATSVLLWTRYRPASGDPAMLRFEVSQSIDFAQVASGGEVGASPERDWCAKAVASGLAPNQWYYFRFIAPDGSMSPVGRTRTLPIGETSKWRMAVFSCSNYGFGHFNAYAHAAAANDADLTLHLGDYIYEYNRGTYPSSGDAHADRVLWPEHEIVALADYRLRYATYRSDPDLQRIHQILPMISVWDDHESANDSWEDGAQNHQPESEGSWDVRKAAAKRAYREWMPVSDEPYARYEVGDLATLFRLDTRLEGRAQQFDLGSVLSGAQSNEEAMAALAAFRDGAYADPERQLLGAAQEAWLAGGLKRSRGGGTQWQVLIQQVLMGRLSTPSAIVDGLGDGVPEFVRRRVALAATASEAGLPANMDAWDGYPAARERLLTAALDADANLVVLAGDTHNAWAFELDHAGERAGVEFGTHSVSSPGLESSLRVLPPEDFVRLALEANPQLKWADTSQRGYMMVELTPQAASSEFRFLSTIRHRSTVLAGTHRMVAPAGARRLAS